jgi:hypothetical protein
LRRRPLALGLLNPQRYQTSDARLCKHLHLKVVGSATVGNETLSIASSGFLSHRRGSRPHTPAFRCAWLVLQTARYRGQRNASSEFLSRRWGLPPPHTRFPLRSALTCRRLATAGNETPLQDF